MLEIVAVLILVVLLRFQSRRPWIWVVPNGAVFAVALLASLQWLGAKPDPMVWEYRMLGLVPMFLFLGPMAGYWLYGKTGKSMLSNIPVILGCVLAAGCLMVLSDATIA